MSQNRAADSDVSKPWSKKVTKRRRRSAVKDQKAIAITRVFTPLAVPAANGPLVVNPTPPRMPANDDHKAPSEIYAALPVSDGRA
jgi:hypothetical protein